MNKKAILLALAGVVLMLLIAFGAYQAGSNSPKDNQVTAEKDAVPEVISDKDVSDLGNRIARLQSKLDDVKKKSAEVQASIDATQQVSSNLEAMNARVDALPEKVEPKEVSLPPDSPSAKVLARPKTDSGIPVSVLEDYQKETGVSPEEIEELMRRQE